MALMHTNIQHYFNYIKFNTKLTSMDLRTFPWKWVYKLDGGVDNINNMVNTVLNIV